MNQLSYFSVNANGSLVYGTTNKIVWGVAEGNTGNGEQPLVFMAY